MKWNFYSSNELKPKGWLRRQLEIQAEGLCGNLDKVWRDVRDSKWIGGDAEGWERVPYWLDGFLPMAYLLDDEGLKSRAQKYVDAIINNQRADGWICPCPDEEIPTYDTWAVQLISKILTVYYSCSRDERVPEVLYRVMKNYYDLLADGTINISRNRWASYRWYEAYIAISFLQERYSEPWLADLARILKEQGVDYTKLMDKWVRPLNAHRLDTHVVNLAMMLKFEALSSEVQGECYEDIAEVLYQQLCKYNGTPVGTFTGDECLSGLSPIQGTELCAVVELMYSFEILYACTGDYKWAERLERVAFNALPAAISDDMWAHQYVQMSNQISCERFPGRSLFRTNNSEAHLFGLEPHFGCCTSNFGQGWPKLALAAFMYRDNIVSSVIPIPSEISTNDYCISLETNYPFENKLTYSVQAKQNLILEVRIPSFAENIRVNGIIADKTDMLVFEVEQDSKCNYEITFDVTPHFEDRPGNLKTLVAGSLVFAVPVRYEKIAYEYIKNEVERKKPYCDYEYRGISEWRYGYVDTPAEFCRGMITDIPFSSALPPVHLKAKVKRINWEYEDGFETVCAKMPNDTTPIGEEETIHLYPYGCAKLRMTELPVVE